VEKLSLGQKEVTLPPESPQGEEGLGSNDGPPSIAPSCKNCGEKLTYQITGSKVNN